MKGINNMDYITEKYWKIANKAIEITKKIGYDLEKSGYYCDEYIGREYQFDKLIISYYDEYSNPNKRLYINIDKKTVLNYNVSKGEIEFVEGTWTQLIELIHEKIPTILQERQIEKIKKQRKIEELKSLEEYFKYIVECGNKENGNMSRINFHMKGESLNIKVETHYDTIRNNSTGDDELYNPHKIYMVYYQGNKVAEFYGNTFNIFPNLDTYSEKFVPGEWIPLFTRMVDALKRIDQYKERRLLEDNVSAIIKKLKTF